MHDPESIKNPLPKHRERMCLEVNYERSEGGRDEDEYEVNNSAQEESGPSCPPSNL